MLKEKTINFGSLEINYAEGPRAGSPLVLLHGFPGCWQELLFIIPSLVLQWHIYALDARGQGKSGRTSGQYLYKHFVADVEHFLQQRLDEPAIIFGHSAGGRIALSVAAKRPDLVKAVIVGDSPIDQISLLERFSSEDLKQYYSALYELAKLDLSIDQLKEKLSSIPIRVPGKDEKIRYGDSPGMDAVLLHYMANRLKRTDPEIFEWFATGRSREFVEGYDLNRMLEQITCTILLLQGNPSLGGMMTNDEFNHAINPIDIVQNGQKIGEATGNEYILNPAQASKIAKESSFARKLFKSFERKAKKNK